MSNTVSRNSVIGIVAIQVTTVLFACSPPQRQTIALCQSMAISGGRGHALDASDIGELTEACMLSKGYALKENGPLCTDDAASAANPNCYYPNTILGRLGALFSKD
jgi:hypothetical protein